ncbi:hypothetical protein HDF16_001998 [Granulicella aggregans]|uniref:Uncharacterized protein n=1 Tax=Granulicella aggregans TaxID=474949 RepID=A0A7W7ZCP0_9BACT|nr:hypothetical protein [Granulicella aggregans]MBB5057313.1 hypothetical protein [Granulicella aggregans]
MNEFDELLRDVLSADVCVEPPLGMGRRIAAALSVAEERRSRMPRIALEAIAAVLLIGVVGMMVFRHRGVAVPDLVSDGRVLIAATPAPDVQSEIIPTKEFLLRAKHRWLSKPVVRSRRFSRRAAPGVAPIAIESLAIKPIEVASLYKSTERSSGGGEKR